ncbi:MAG TPA: 3-methyl-2-oxobutanoate hydroxymethyltransferase [Candidatus Limnocylindria bacterium]|nr:3-methyl-2-oxobutanoate hydroxymethyltransferase [Candidatus Limnocylindria bacterium]
MNVAGLPQKITVQSLASMKGRAAVAALTAYDFPMAKLLDEAGIPFLLVGDSLGMVVLGHPDTTHVTMEDILHHTRAVARAKPQALMGADLPYRSYDTPEQALANARRLVEAGAEFVKAEGGREILPQVEAILAAGIPFCAHLGMLPQHVVEEGGKYRIKGRDDAGRVKLLDDAVALEAAGAFACVLELVTPPVAKEMTERCAKMLTIGIGSGPDCDGQILVTPDLIGAFPWFTPKFVTPKVQTGEAIRGAVREWARGISSAEFRVSNSKSAEGGPSPLPSSGL